MFKIEEGQEHRHYRLGRKRERSSRAQHEHASKPLLSLPSTATACVPAPPQVSPPSRTLPVRPYIPQRRLTWLSDITDMDIDSK